MGIGSQTVFNNRERFKFPTDQAFNCLITSLRAFTLNFTHLHLNMKQAVVLAAVLALAIGAPQYLVENKEMAEKLTDGCRMEYVTVWEDVETEEVNKVICETEFKEECFTEYEEVCVNATEKVCSMVDEMVCVDSLTNKCGLEQVLKNETYTETECTKVYKNICEYEWIGEGKTKKWVPVEDSCVTKPFEDCEDVVKYKENFVEEEVCRDIPIKDCRNMPKEVCVDPAENEICEEIPTEKREIVPHEECKQITGTVPKKVSKKVTKVMCDEDEEPKESVNEIELKTSIDAADVSENEISDNPELDKPENPEIVVDEKDLPVDNIKVEEAELGIDIDEEPTAVTTEKSIETTEQPIETSETVMETTEMVTIQTTAEDIVTKTVTSVTTEAPEAVKDITTEIVETQSSQAPRRKYDDSRIIFSDEAIDNRNKVLATRVFIDDGLLSPQPAQDAAVKPAPKGSSDNDRIFFPDQDFKG